MRRLFISNSDISSLKKFFMATLLLGVLIVAVFEFILYRLGETAGYEAVLKRQMKTGELYLPQFFNVENEYKRLGLKSTTPRVVALGTSRIIQLSGRWFGSSRDFYNAGVDASTGREIEGMKRLLLSMADERWPEKIILGLDPWFFNPNYPPNERSFKNKVLKFVERYQPLRFFYDVYRFVLRRFRAYDALTREKSRWPAMVFDDRPAGIGLSARVHQAGFRMDGSFVYPRDLALDPVQSSTEWIRCLRSDRYRFAAADELDLMALEELTEILRFCRDKKIGVIGVLMPFRNDFYDALTASSRHAGFFSQFRKVTCELVESFGFDCFDLSSPYALGLWESDFIDCNHLKPGAFMTVSLRFLPSASPLSVFQKSGPAKDQSSLK